MEYIHPDLNKHHSIEEVSVLPDDEVIHFVIEYFRTRTASVPPTALPSDLDIKYKTLLIERHLATLEQADFLATMVDRDERFIQRKTNEWFNRPRFRDISGSR